jgi:hypothetical protein
MRRRSFLTLSATTLGGVLVYSLDLAPSLVHAQSDRKIRTTISVVAPAGGWLAWARQYSWKLSPLSRTTRNEAGEVVITAL